MRTNVMTLVVAASLITVFLAGCGKGDGASSATPGKNATADGKKPKAGESKAAGASSPAVTVRKEFEHQLYEGSPAERLAALNQLAVAWYMSQQTPLTSPEQLVKAGMLSKVPAPPEGQRYAMDPETKVFVLTNN
ncbi:MAG: hypothetical protein WCS99_06145 [Limisphaerales bacterium]